MRKNVFPLLAVLVSVMAIASGLNAAEKPADETKVYQALGAKHCIPEGRMNLLELVEHLNAETGVRVVLDRRGMNQYWRKPSELIQLDDYGPMSLGSALRHVLQGDNRDLAWIVRDGSLVITTYNEEEKYAKAEVHYVGDLCGYSDGLRPDEYDYDSIIEMITTIVDPDCWPEGTGPGPLTPFRETITVATLPARMQQRIRLTLAALRKAKELAYKHPEKAPSVVSVPVRTEQEQAIHDALRRPITLQFDDATLDEVVKTLRRETTVPVLLDRNSLVCFSPHYRNVRITYRSRKEPLGRALTRMLVPTIRPPDRPKPKSKSGDSLGEGDDDLFAESGESCESGDELFAESESTEGEKGRTAVQLTTPEKGDNELAWIVKDDALIIAARSAAEWHTEARAYPVLDLLGGLSTRDEFGWDPPEADGDSLVEVVTQAVGLWRWDTCGGEGAITYVPNTGALMIAQTPAVHRDIEEFLAQLRMKRNRRKEPTTSPVASHGKRKGKSLRLEVYTIPASPRGSYPSVGMSTIRNEKKLIEIVTSLIEPKSWKKKNVYINAVSQRLIVRQTDDVHRKIHKLLLRLKGGPQFGFGDVPVPFEQGGMF